jgi:hypothetical protein
MDTSGKITSGVLVPLGVIGLAVGGYFLIFRKKKTSDSKQNSHALKNQLALFKVFQDEDEESDRKSLLGGKRRTRRRRH